MNGYHLRKQSQLNPHSMLFQIGRLLFPDLINSGRAMRFRMILITATLGIALVAATTGILLKEYRAKDYSSVSAKPLKLK